MKLKDKVFFTFSCFIMRPMLGDDPKSTPESRKGMFWRTIKDIWTNKIDLNKKEMK